MFIGLEISARRDERGKLFVRIAPAVMGKDPDAERQAGGVAVAAIAIALFVIVAAYGLASTPDPIIQPTVSFHGVLR